MGTLPTPRTALGDAFARRLGPISVHRHPSGRDGNVECGPPAGIMEFEAASCSARGLFRVRPGDETAQVRSGPLTKRCA